MKPLLAFSCLAFLATAAGASSAVYAAEPCRGVVTVCASGAGAFALIKAGKPATVYVDSGAETGVLRVADDFASDLEKVSGVKPAVVHDLSGITGDVVVIGQLGHSPLLDAWATSGLIQTAAISGQWEAYSQAVVKRPGGGQALVIVGADKRGAIYGTYDISARMGVSPWYWWADVPVEHKADVTVSGGERHDQPVVKYRGFFINDEEPSFGGWAREKFGGINSKLYAHVFELELRLKGNYLWPAMWGKAFAADDPLNQKTANDYGIIMGTSHHEPMTRAQDEWHRNQDQGITGGAWDYTKNAANLRTFWRGGIERALPYENLVTVGMRGDGDEPMSEGTATQLLEGIVADQRQIITEVTGKPADQTPQVWALYKEVQDYYDHGMKVPDDVTLLFADDNWGQIRRLPEPGKTRSGGYGVYYHFDYVGGPRNYKWLNTNQIEKVWQQMNLAYESGVDRLWIVNVGDIKPMEYPLSFFLDMAWNPKAMDAAALKAYPAKWAGQQFGAEQAEAIGEILTRYSQYNARRKPELLNENSFNLNNYNEFGAVYLDWYWLRHRVDDERANLRERASAAYFQLVQYPVDASENLYGMYISTARNHAYADVKDPRADAMAGDVAAQFSRDGVLASQYNELLGGKWNHMMDQTHIGYTGWQQPDKQIMPDITKLSKPAAKTRLAIGTINGSLSGSVEAACDGKARCIEQDGYIAIEAEHFARKFDTANVRWQVIPDLGRTLSSVITLPQIAPATTDQSVRLEYDISLTKAADATLNLYLAPTLDTAGKGGLRIGVSIDDQPMQTLSFDLKPDKPDWNQAVSDNIVILKAPFTGLTAGPHTLKVFRIDGNVVLERLVLDTGGLKPSYLGPPESPNVH